MTDDFGQGDWACETASDLCEMVEEFVEPTIPFHRLVIANLARNVVEQASIAWSGEL